MEALAAALDQGTALVPDYAGVFKEGQVDPAAGIRRVVVGATAEPEDERGLTQGGREQVTQLRCWGATWFEANALARAVHDVLHGWPLSLPSFRMVQARLGRVTDYPDPDPEILAHVVITEYRTRTVALA
jgi:hypothetical protein